MRHVVFLTLSIACSSPSPDSDTPGTDAPGTDAPGSVAIDGRTSGAALALPPLNAKLDYQLGGAYTPPTGVGIISRDRTASPAAGVYSICYINGFQIQPGEESRWTQPVDLRLKTAGGTPVIDTEWDETLIDVSTPDKRSAVAAIIGGWIDECHQAGFAAIEIDNLDSYNRSTGLLTEDDAVATMHLFAQRAHASGMAIAQKNSSELVPRKAELGTDFATAEECDRYSECDAYRAGYGDHVIVIEYRRADFEAGCTNFPNLSIILRDVDLVTPTTSGYVYDAC